MKLVTLNKCLPHCLYRNSKQQAYLYICVYFVPSDLTGSYQKYDQIRRHL